MCSADYIAVCGTCKMEVACGCSTAVYGLSFIDKSENYAKLSFEFVNHCTLSDESCSCEALQWDIPIFSKSALLLNKEATPVNSRA